MDHVAAGVGDGGADLLPDRVGRIEHQQQLARLVEIFLQRVDLVREEIGLRSGDDDDRGVVGHRALLRDHQLVDGVVFAAERRGNRAVAVAIGLRRGFLLAVPLREVHLPLLSRHHLDDAVGDLLLGIIGDALGASFVVEDDRAVLLNLILLGDRRLLVGIDVLGRDLLRRVLVFLDLVLILREVGLAREHHYLQRRVELREDGATLIGQAELLVHRQVPPLVLLGADVIDGDQDAEHDEHAEARERPVARLPSLEHVRDLAPLPERVEQNADETADRQRP